MKPRILITILSFLGTLVVNAKDEKAPAIPKEKEGRWGIYSYTEAKEEAAKKKRPIAFLVQDDKLKDEEPTEREANNRVFWGLSKECTMMVVPTRLIGEAKARCSETVFAALSMKSMAKDTSRLIVMDQTGEKILGVMNKDAIIASDEKSLKAFARQMQEYNKDPSKAPVIADAAPTAPAAPAAPAKGAAAPAPAAAGPVAIKDAKPENWTNAKGQTIQATLLEVDGDLATLLLANGTKANVPVSSLAAASQKRVQELKDASAK